MPQSTQEQQKGGEGKGKETKTGCKFVTYNEYCHNFSWSTFLLRRSWQCLTNGPAKEHQTIVLPESS